MRMFAVLCLICIFFACSKKEEEVVDGLESGEHRIFISSSSYTGNLGGSSGADDKCKALAQAQGLEKTYKAVLGTASVAAKDRISVTGAIYLFTSSGNKRQIASGASKLWGANDQVLLDKIDRDESYNIINSGTAWTGSTATGGSASDDCSGWTSGLSLDNGMTGDNSLNDGRWVESVNQDCSQSFRLYCISQ